MLETFRPIEAELDPRQNLLVTRTHGVYFGRLVFAGNVSLKDWLHFLGAVEDVALSDNFAHFLTVWFGDDTGAVSVSRKLLLTSDLDACFQGTCPSGPGSTSFPVRKTRPSRATSLTS